MRRLLTALLGLSICALAACAAPSADRAQAAEPAKAEVASQDAPEARPSPSPAPAAGAPVRIDRSCRGDADCTVKNVGNCCGALPACVNVASPTDPEGVQRECARSGRMSVCGFKPVEGCQCVQGQCKDKVAEVEMVR
ncbi:MAG TPA: hypothetical protein VGD42_04150 [Lysobacter sp.]